MRACRTGAHPFSCPSRSRAQGRSPRWGMEIRRTWAASLASSGRPIEGEHTRLCGPDKRERTDTWGPVGLLLVLFGPFAARMAGVGSHEVGWVVILVGVAVALGLLAWRRRMGKAPLEGAVDATVNASADDLGATGTSAMSEPDVLR